MHQFGKQFMNQYLLRMSNNADYHWRWFSTINHRHCVDHNIVDTDNYFLEGIEEMNVSDFLSIPKMNSGKNTNYLHAMTAKLHMWTCRQLIQIWQLTTRFCAFSVLTARWSHSDISASSWISWINWLMCWIRNMAKLANGTVIFKAIASVQIGDWLFLCII